MGDERVFHPHELENLPEVERAMRVLNEWRIISREAQPENSVIQVRGVAFGGDKVLNIAAVDSARDKNFADADSLFADPFQANRLADRNALIRIRQ